MARNRQDCGANVTPAPDTHSRAFEANARNKWNRPAKPLRYDGRIETWGLAQNDGPSHAVGGAPRNAAVRRKLDAGRGFGKCRRGATSPLSFRRAHEHLPSGTRCRRSGDGLQCRRSGRPADRARGLSGIRGIASRDRRRARTVATALGHRLIKRIQILAEASLTRAR